MLSDGEIEKIKEMIDQSKSDYMIGKLLRHSPNTIKDVRRKYQNSEKSVTQGEEIYLKNPIDQTRKLADDMDNVIKMGNLRAGEKKKWQKRENNIRNILREEFDEKRFEVEADAVEKQNQIWNIFLDQNYVKKEEVTNLNNIIYENNTTINNLRNSISEKDILMQNIQDEMSRLKDTFHRQIEMLQNHMRNLSNKNIELEETVGDLSGYIGNYLDDAGRRERENLRYEKEVFNVEKTDFDGHVQTRQSILDNMYFEIDKKLKAVEKREEKVANREENVKKQQQELNATRKIMSEIKNNLEKWQEAIDNQRENIKKRWKTVLKTSEEQRTEGHRLQKWQTNLEKTRGFNKFSLPCPDCGKPMLFDITNNEIYEKINEIFGRYMHYECIKNKQQRRVILSPTTYSGEPIIQLGFSPTIQSGGEIMIAKPIAEPNVQSGYPILQSGEKVKLVADDPEPVFQSGFSPSYYSGIGNFDKNSKKGSKFSS